MWAHVWAHTVHPARDHRATLSLAPFVRPRIEPEVVFGLNAPIASSSTVLEPLAELLVEIADQG